MRNIWRKLQLGQSLECEDVNSHLVGQQFQSVLNEMPIQKHLEQEILTKSHASLHQRDSIQPCMIWLTACAVGYLAISKRLAK
jgi:hypothetical protein